MKLYLCKLVSPQGCLRECFWREGVSARSVIAGLKLFRWPAGRWHIVAAADDDE